MAPAIDEAELATLVSATPHSYALAPENIDLIARSMWTGSKIICNGGEKLVVWNPGFAGRFREAIREWARNKGIETKGL